MRPSTLIRRLEDALLRRFRGRKGGRRRIEAKGQAIVARLRARGVRIGEGCLILTENFSSEPYLVEIGDNVRVAPGTHFITHDGSVMLSGARHVGTLILGRIIVGSNTFIGLNCLILPGSVIGRDCIIGAGSVVRGTIPDGSVAMGNPARVVMSVKMAEQLAGRQRHRLDIPSVSGAEREKIIREHFGLA